MAQRRHHYERAFEGLLRARRIPYVSVDEARKALLPRGASMEGAGGDRLKSFDFVIYGESSNLLVEVKGRRLAPTGTRLESWVTLEDVRSLAAWERLFGLGFEAAFVFLYWCEAQPPDALFEDVFVDHDRWYACRAVTVSDYASGMKARSERWGTVDLPRRTFDRLSRPFAACLAPGRDAPPLAALEPLASAGCLV